MQILFATSATRATVVQIVEVDNQMKCNIAVYSQMYSTRVLFLFFFLRFFLVAMFWSVPIECMGIMQAACAVTRQ